MRPDSDSDSESGEAEWNQFFADIENQEQEYEVDSESNERVSSGSESEAEIDTDTLALELGLWASQNNISVVALSGLLSLLRVFHPSLPKDPRTLMKTPRESNITAVEGGAYFHFGIVESLSKSKDLLYFLSHSQSHHVGPHNISLQVNIDGLPLFKSTCTQFWPILGRVCQPLEMDPFMIGLYCGQHKPASIDEYLHDFVEEMRLLEHGPVELECEGRKCAVQVNLSCFVCDAPARAYVKQVKGHSGYYGCEKCTQKGSWESKIVFPEIDAPPRTDVQFDDMTDVHHHTGNSPLRTLSVGMVTQFPLDYMHLVCLGVTRRLLFYWLKSPVSKGIRLGLRVIGQISESLITFRSFLPREFSRKCRSLKDVERWKATEFRQFLLYSGIVALKGQISTVLYKHFLLLFVALLSAVPLFVYVTPTP